MGYTTKFSGVIALSKPLNLTQAKYLLDVNEQDVAATGKHPDGYMQWVPTVDLRGIVWDGNEKFYDYKEWMFWLVSLLATWDITASGTLYWSGEETDDTGSLVVNGMSVIANPTRRMMPAGQPPLTRDALNDMVWKLAEIADKP